MEHKIEMTLTAMGAILSNYYPPSHIYKRLYALQRLGIRVPKIHHNDRKKKLTSEDKEKLVRLFQDLQRYVKYYGVEVFHKYYVDLWQNDLVDILNGT